MSGNRHVKTGLPPVGTQAHRIRIANRDNWICGICAKSIDPKLSVFESDMAASVLHIIPKWAGGTHEDDNLKIAHLRCNLIKGKAYPRPHKKPEMGSAVICRPGGPIRVPAYTYAIHFPLNGILKVGYSTVCDEYTVNGVNRRFRLNFTSYISETGTQIWRHAGDLPQEAYLNVRMSCRFKSADTRKGTTLNEWWNTKNHNASSLVVLLDKWTGELKALKQSIAA